MTGALLLAVLCCVPALGFEPHSMQGTGIIPGMVSSEARNYYAILGIFRDSPAAKTRLRVGDRLISINGREAWKYANTEDIFFELNPPAGRTVRFVAVRPAPIMGERGERFESSLVSARIRVSTATVPRMGIPEGRILEAGKFNFCTTSYDSRDGVWYGDHFFIFDRSDCIGTATLQINRSLSRVLIQDPPGKDNLEALKGMDLVFFRPRKQSDHTKSDVREWNIRLPKQRPHPVYDRYDRDKSYERLAGEVMGHYKQDKRIVLKETTSIRTLWGSSYISGGERKTLVETRYRRVEIHYTSSTDEIPKGAKNDVKKGDYVGIFYKNKDDKDIIEADLVHILNMD